MGALVALGGLALVFRWIERRAPAIALRPRRLRETITDLTYWFLGPALIRPLVQAIVITVVALAAFAITGARDPDAIATAFSSGSPIGRQPAWLQAIELLVVWDFMGYWIHRAFHRGVAWRVHAIHHGAERLDWLAAVRVHPLNELFAILLRALPLFLLGFRLDLLAATAPAFAFYALLLHANVAWDFGPLRAVLASPAFHRWHHAADVEGRDCNFAGLLPVWDILFGTFHLPRGRLPHATGADVPIPDGFLQQLRHPWSAARRG